MFPSSIG